jgi:fucose 4-O-acetylase-like acetyltransferase
MPDTTLSPFTSSKFRFWSFAAMALLVYVHGYNLGIRYLQPWTVPGEPMTFTGFFEYFLANGILRFRIPMLFIISGFLYALHDQRPYRQRTGKRFRTLILPYLIWSALGFAFTFGLEMIPWGKNLVAGSNIVRIDDARALLHDYKWYEMLARLILFPVPYQLWFIRVLFVYNLAYPGIRWCVTHRIWRWVFFSLAFLMWLGTMGFGLVEGEGVLFFSLGVWLQKTGFDIEVPKRALRPLWWGIAFVSLSAVKTVLAFKGLPLMGTATYYVIAFMHKGVVLSGLIACWYGGDALVRWCMSRKWFLWLSAFSFMIYALHAPLVAYATDVVFAWAHPFTYYRLATYLLLPLVIIAFCVGTGVLLRRTVPKVYGVLTGGRGLV